MWYLVLAVTVFVLVTTGRAIHAKLLAKTAFWMLNQPDPEARAAAAQQLARLARRRYPNAFEALDRACDDEDPLVRRTASRLRDAVGEACGGFPITPIPDQLALDAYKVKLLSEDSATRAVAAETLRSLGDPWLYQAGVQIRREFDGYDVETRRRAVRALGHLRDPLSSTKLLFILVKESDPQILRAAALAASEVRAWNCQEVLRGRAHVDSEPEVS
jgi:HEAT repeat protein